MDLFYYKAIDAGGRIIKGQLDALNPVDLEVRLGRLGLELVNCKEVQATRSSAGAGIKRKDLITFCLHLEQLLEAGVPIAICCDNTTVSRTNSVRESARAAEEIGLEAVEAAHRAAEAHTFIHPETALRESDGE